MLKYTSEGPVLTRGTKYSAGLDLRSFKLLKTLGETYYYSTGIKLQIPEGYVGYIHERSSLHKKGYTLANSVGVIDSDYRGDVIVALKRHSGSVELTSEDRVAQLVVVKCFMEDPVKICDLDDTERGDGGFGSTDKI